ncbi:MAG: DUF1540 domain-containing protein [Firmicutes bacterium]|nr:DUF1540 domain-containing protein [Bacillota bacterium]
MVEVNCSVSSCWFWKMGNRCGAESIWVRRTGGGADARLEAAADTWPDEAAAVLTSADTCCETFRPRRGPA